MLELAASLQERGQPSRLIVPENRTSEPLAEKARRRGVRVERTPLLHVDGDGARQSIPALIKLLRPLRDSLVHFHTGDVCLPRRALVAAGLLQLPNATVTIHGSQSNVTPGDLRASQWAFAANRLFRRVACPSDHSRQNQTRLGVHPNRAVTIRNGVDFARFSTGDRDAVRQELGIEPADPLVTFTSRLEPGKRPMDALVAFSRVAPDHPRARLAFVGCGILQAEMEETARRLGLADRIVFAGFRQNIHDWLAATDVWLFPTEGENFSVALLEAMAAGCAIVSTDCQGNDEIVRDGENALAVPVGDVDALAARLNHLLLHPEERRRLGAEAQRQARTYSIERMVSAYASLYDSIREANGIPLARPA
jgi:glycosyltransferase involved in cell wall biosynthesis